MRKETERSSWRKKTETKTFGKHTRNCSKTNKASKTAQVREQARDSQCFKKLKKKKRIGEEFSPNFYLRNMISTY
jgi:hypothetical protein